jgi:hypothetical protein
MPARFMTFSGPTVVTMDEVAGYTSAALGTRVEYRAR